jgi:amidase
MVTSDLKSLYEESDALQLAAHVRAGEVSSAELLETAITVIEERNPALNAVVIKTYEIGRDAAKTPSEGAFAGVPFLLKNIGSMWQGTPLTNGYSYMKDHVCDYDTEMVRKIKAAGFLLLGRTNTPEGGWCIGTEPRLYGPTRNPWRSDLTPGGSSGGAAAAVASRLIPLAEASDGGGSIRVPASCCDLVGLKPSRGRITYGPQTPDVWLGSVSTFCVTRTVRDTAAYLDAVAGTLPGDPYTAPLPETSWLRQSRVPPSRLRVGYTTKPAWNDRLAPEVSSAIQTTLKLLESFGHDIEEHDMAVDLRAVWAEYNHLNAVETATDFDRLAKLFGRAVRQEEVAPVNWALIERGRAMSARDYARSIAALRLASHQIASDIAAYDVWLTPTLTQLPRPVGYWSMEEQDLDAYLDRWSDAGYMFCFNVSGLPAISVPVAVTDDMVPIGLQLVGRHGDEATLLRLAQQMQDAIRWQNRRPGKVDVDARPARSA